MLNKTQVRTRFTDAGFFVLRTPLLPWNDVEQWSRGLAAARAYAQGADLQAAAAADTALLCGRLREIGARPVVRSALNVASPHFYARIAPWLDGQQVSDEQELARTLVRYFMRMAGRATPFGLFAGTSVGVVGGSTHLCVPPISEHVRHTRLDFAYLCQLAASLEKNASLQAELTVSPTSIAYPVAGRLRYYEARLGGSVRTYHLVDAKPTPHLETALHFANQRGGATVHAIAEEISVKFTDIPLSDALDYVRELLDSGLLCSALGPVVTGSDDPARELIAQLSKLPSGKSFARILHRALDAISALDAAGIESPPKDSEQIAEHLAELPAEANAGSLLRVDLRKPSPNLMLSRTLVQEIALGVEVLARVAPFSHYAPLTRFIREFELRYAAREVPLLEALDEDTGIGFGDAAPVSTSLLDGLPLSQPRDDGLEWGTRDAHLLSKLSEALRSGALEIALTDTDIDALSTRRGPSVPHDVTVLASISASSAEALRAGGYRIHLRRCIGPSSAKLFARFCHGDSQLEAHVRAALQQEEACDAQAIHAELVHLPQPRAGNVICRPILRSYEIPILTCSGASPDRQLALTDLFVSIQNGKVCLRSETLGRRVVPHLTCAHAFRKSGLGLYRFLASVSEQGTSHDLRFSWGPLATAPFLPRVTYRNLVLAPAFWSIPGDHVKQMDLLSSAQRFAALQDLRARLQLPRVVWFEDGDNTLPVDFENILSLESFVEVAARLKSIPLREAAPYPGELVAAGEAGRFHHELLVPLIRRASDENTRPVLEPVISFPRRQAKGVGSGWLFVKVYCSQAAQDRVLVRLMLPFVQQLRAQHTIERWFFVRQEDTGSHLRLRIRTQPSILWREVAPPLFELMTGARDLIQSVVIDEYWPEDVRYGGTEGLEIAEQIFEADSEAAILIIEACGDDLEARWRLTAVGMNGLLDDLGLSIEQKRDVVQCCRSAQLSQLAARAGLRRAVAKKCRALRSEMQRLLTDASQSGGTAARVLRIRSQAVVALAERLRLLEAAQRLTLPLTRISESYLHMWANRMLRHATNTQELVIYELLFRYYDESVQRGHSNKSTSDVQP